MYHIREVVLKNNKTTKKRHVIEFDDPDMAIVGEFLMIDCPLGHWSILQDMDKVLQGGPAKHISGNRCGAYITQDTTEIYDLFSSEEDLPSYPCYTMDTESLRELIVMWREQVHT